MAESEPRDIDLRAYGYAPGHYLCGCMHCGQHHEADKRAASCETCAMRRALVDFRSRAEKAESALATAEAAGMERAWQPIETAPKDGLFLTCGGIPGYEIWHAKTFQQAIADDVKPFLRHLVESARSATHWTTLPPPPQRVTGPAPGSSPAGNAEIEGLRARVESLTLNELALAQCGADLAVAWWKLQNKQSSYSRAEIAKFMALRAKLDAILNKFSLPANEEGARPDNGKDIVRLIWDRVALSQDGSAER